MTNSTAATRHPMDYVSEFLSDREIARMVDAAGSTVARWRAQQKIPARDPQRTRLLLLHRVIEELQHHDPYTNAWEWLNAWSTHYQANPGDIIRSRWLPDPDGDLGFMVQLGAEAFVGHGVREWQASRKLEIDRDWKRTIRTAVLFTRAIGAYVRFYDGALDQNSPEHIGFRKADALCIRPQRLQRFFRPRPGSKVPPRQQGPASAAPRPRGIGARRRPLARPGIRDWPRTSSTRTGRPGTSLGPARAPDR